jgi:hypothetical protein
MKNTLISMIKIIKVSNFSGFPFPGWEQSCQGKRQILPLSHPIKNAVQNLLVASSQ